MAKQLNVKQAKKIVVQSALEETVQSQSLKYAIVNARKRKTIIRKEKNTQKAQICAAIEIQRNFRGYSTRCRLQNLVNYTGGYTNYKPKYVREPSPYPEEEEEYDEENARMLARLQENYRLYCIEMRKLGREPVSFEEFCAKYTDNWEEEMMMSITSSDLREKERQKKSEAATVIQKAWRRHIDIQVYRYYRDLINFKARGDPGMMLKCINPNEARLLDAAAGIHIKFRLAGDKFPPNIYYKIFTHRPIQDMCANSPKDYTKPDTKKPMARHVHNKGHVPIHTNPEDWYQRWENNGWRLVSDRLIRVVSSDSVTWETAQKKMFFDHRKIRRKQDVDRRKKEKKIEWMKKMFREGVLQPRSEEPETVALIEGAARGMVAAAETHGPQVIEEWEVDELLQWTTSLNFDDYLKDWKALATSAVSEDPLHGLTQPSPSDPYELLLSLPSEGSRVLKAGMSTRQSHNTPVSNQSVTSLV